jgi:glyoxylase-like metal-dependent hydrolase (beta-lactamase superfamily II)
MEIIPNVHLIPSLAVNVYLIVDPDGLTLIDAGLARTGRKILKTVADLGHSPRALRRIIVTHVDGDHVGGLAALKAASGAAVYAHPLEAEALAAGRLSRQLQFNPLVHWLFRLTPWSRVEPVTVDELVSEGQVLPVLGGLHVVDTPGHTPGHISLFAPSAGLIFTGDSLASAGEGLILSREAYAWDRAQARASVRKQAGLGASIVCPAHGPVIKDAAGKFPDG